MNFHLLFPVVIPSLDMNHDQVKFIIGMQN